MSPAASAPRRAPERLRTPRLWLARLGRDDLADLCRMHRDPRVMATLGGVRDDARTASFLGEWAAHWDLHGFGVWALREPGSGRFLGRGGLRQLTLDAEPVVEIAYALVAGAWGRGLATELARICCRVGFETLGLDALVAFTLPHNRASRRVMEQCGLAFVRSFRRAELPHVLYRIDAATWRARSGG